MQFERNAREPRVRVFFSLSTRKQLHEFKVNFYPMRKHANPRTKSRHKLRTYVRMHVYVCTLIYGDILEMAVAVHNVVVYVHKGSMGKIDSDSIETNGSREFCAFSVSEPTRLRYVS